ncbi:hypothetical protein [Bdellovibrio svalbardensis]|uniref:Secreted protein n=1 Tax=Bdellovibrio svalbardensis TaxID=2972972 RepID=A0ABT6DQI1_9BACT|nr:hypothetical protein [Bdellovibrio svalbardensis]MDG0817413.1 hypothetical protein [Bdellovibrio svalbardensis]
MRKLNGTVTIIVTMLSLLLGSPNVQASAQASKCHCTVDPYTKTYDAKEGVVKTWYGGKRSWACTYTCTTPQGEAKIIGRHKKTYVGSDNGLWGICDGLEYKEEYNMYSGDFVYMLDRMVGLDPKDSTSPDLVKFSNDFCR